MHAEKSHDKNDLKHFVKLVRGSFNNIPQTCSINVYVK